MLRTRSRVYGRQGRSEERGEGLEEPQRLRQSHGLGGEQVTGQHERMLDTVEEEISGLKDGATESTNCDAQER